MNAREEEALRRFAIGIASTTARMFDDRLMTIERDFAELLSLIIEHGDLETVATVRLLMEERQMQHRHLH